MTRWIPAVAICLASGATAQSPAERFLPLAVGNSWCYEHTYRSSGDHALVRELTIEITHTELIDKRQYWGFSAVEDPFAPLPYFFMAGKLMRWTPDGQLIERKGDDDVVLFDFSAGEPATYPIPMHEGDTEVLVLPNEVSAVPTYLFSFLGHTDIYEHRSATFMLDFGLSHAFVESARSDYTEALNELLAVRAVIGGQPIEYEDARTGLPTVVPRLTWFDLKQRHVPVYGGP